MILILEDADDSLNENLLNNENKQKLNLNFEKELSDSEEIFKDVCTMDKEDADLDVFHTPISSNLNSDDDFSDYEDADDGTNPDGIIHAMYIFIHGYSIF